MTLRELRESRGFTLKEAAEQIDYNIGNLSRIERRQQALTLNVAVRLARLYEASIDEIVADCITTHKFVNDTK